MAKEKTATRRGGRALAFQVLYGLTFTPATSAGELRAAYWQSPDNAAALAAAREMQEKEAKQGQELYPAGFAWELVEGVWKDCARLDALINAHAKNWRTDRIGRIELTVLRLALFELTSRRDDVPAKVAINEALDLAKNFGDQKAASFVNGILDAVCKEQATI